jgi:hypothetical protein
MISAVEEEIGMTRMTKYNCRTPGRLRMTSPHLKNHPGRAMAVETALSQIQGVISVKASTFGNLFIRYDTRQLAPDVLLDSAHRTISSEVAMTAIPRDVADTAYRPSQRPVAETGNLVGSKLGDMLVNMLVEKSVERLTIAVVAALL